MVFVGFGIEWEGGGEDNCLDVLCVLVEEEGGLGVRRYKLWIVEMLLLVY